MEQRGTGNARVHPLQEHRRMNLVAVRVMTGQSQTGSAITMSAGAVCETQLCRLC